MTPRRLNVLVDWLPAEARVRQVLREAEEKTQGASKVAKLRERQAFYEAQKRKREEASDGN